jgi:hypothetical protein
MILSICNLEKLFFQSFIIFSTFYYIIYIKLLFYMKYKKILLKIKYKIQHNTIQHDTKQNNSK